MPGRKRARIIAPPCHSAPRAPGAARGRGPPCSPAAGSVPAPARRGGPAPRRERTPARPRQQLQAVKAEIERVTPRGERRAGRARPPVARAARARSCRWGEARESLDRRAPRARRGRRAPRRARRREEARARGELSDNRAALAGQMRAAYLIGRQEPLKLLLNQKDPALAGRMFAYYSYFGRARAGQIKLIEDDVQRLAELDQQLADEDATPRGAGKAAARAAPEPGAGARAARARARQPRGAVAHPRPEPRAAEEPAGRAREAAARAARRARALSRRGQRCVHAPARQARLAGERAPGGALRRVARRRGALGRGAGGDRARHAGEGGVRRAGSSTRTGCRGSGCWPSSTTATAT